jgi:hypothetical protein
VFVFSRLESARISSLILSSSNSIGNLSSEREEEEEEEHIIVSVVVASVSSHIAQKENVVRRARRLESRGRGVSVRVANGAGPPRTFAPIGPGNDRPEQRSVFHAKPFGVVRVQIMPHHPRQRRKLFSAHARETTPTKLSEKSRERSARDESVTATKDESGTSETSDDDWPTRVPRDQTVRFAFAKEVFVISNRISRAGDERETNAQVHELVRTESRTVG